jgi:4-amino-4-deoxy-L-arabinose transferase-like glycosyltransferase
MFRFQTRPAHYALLTTAYLLLTLPNLGAHTLWDMDEGVNAEAAREMLESGNWITPYYNYQLRTAKPALLYWLQGLSFLAFGVNEWAARFPAVACGLGSVSVTYELGRRMFSPSTGLLSGLILGSCVEFCLISHAATPDPPLVFFLTLAFYLYWVGSEGERRWWFIPVAMCCGLAVLTKGPVGVAMPGVVIVLHLAWTRRLRKLWDPRLFAGALAFILVAGPWYGMVTLDTRGKWLTAFVENENIRRFSSPSEGHRGGPWYHVLGLVVFFAPWSVFLLEAVWHTARRIRLRPEPVAEFGAGDTADKYRFLTVWVVAYLVFFSVAATKLPNYILPLYPAIAILTARTLDRWRDGTTRIPGWMIATSTVGVALIGVLLTAGLLFASGLVSPPVPVKGFHPLPKLGEFAWLGVIPVVAALAFGCLAKKGLRDEAITALGLGCTLLLAIVAAFPTVAMNEYKAPKYIAEEVGLRQTDREIRIAACRWFRHSLVFYLRREVKDIDDLPQLEQFLALPRPAYLVVPDDVWTELSKKLTVPMKEVARRYDFYARRDILVLANSYADPD